MILLHILFNNRLILYIHIIIIYIYIIEYIRINMSKASIKEVSEDGLPVL